MTRTYWAAAGILGLAGAISLGLWATGFPPEWDLDKGETVSALRNFLTAPLRLVAVGAVATVLMIALKRKRSEGAGKAGRIAIMGVLFIPILTLFLQVAMPLMLYDVIGEREADYAFAGLSVLFFLVMGNYIVTAPFEARIGFRTKWTLSDPVVWAKTHRFLGRNLVFGALLTLPLFAVIDADYVLYAPIVFAVLLKGIAWLYARSLSQRLALRNT